MALPLILRNASKLQGSTLNLSKLISTQTSNYSILSANKISNRLQFISVVPTTKRGIALSPVRLSAGGDHSKLWPIERALSAALIGLVPAAIAFPNPVLDNLLAVSVVAHLHWGIEACVVDYVRVILFGPLIPKLALGLVYIITATTLGGLIYFNVNDIGIGKTVRKFWAIKN